MCVQCLQLVLIGFLVNMKLQYSEKYFFLKMFRLLSVEFCEGTEVYFMALGSTFCVWLVNPFYTESINESTI